MTEWEMAVKKVEAIHRGACVLLSVYDVIGPHVKAEALKHSAELYKLAEDAVLGPLNEEDK